MTNMERGFQKPESEPKAIQAKADLDASKDLGDIVDFSSLLKKRKVSNPKAGKAFEEICQAGKLLFEAHRNVKAVRYLEPGEDRKYGTVVVEIFWASVLDATATALLAEILSKADDSFVYCSHPGYMHISATVKNICD